MNSKCRLVEFSKMDEPGRRVSHAGRAATKEPVGGPEPGHVTRHKPAVNSKQGLGGSAESAACRIWPLLRGDKLLLSASSFGPLQHSRPLPQVSAAGSEDSVMARVRDKQTFLYYFLSPPLPHPCNIRKHPLPRCADDSAATRSRLRGFSLHKAGASPSARSCLLYSFNILFINLL